MTTILLVRHGETDWNAELRWQGHSDRLLNERGREQARALARELAETDIDAVYASDLRRAVETAEIVARELGVPVVLDRGLREVDAGSWEGLTHDEIRERDPEAHARFGLTGEPGWSDGETYAEMAARAHAAVRAIAAAHPGGTVLVITHGGPVKSIMMAADGRDYLTERRTTPPIGNCEVCRIAVEDGTLRRLD